MTDQDHQRIDQVLAQASVALTADLAERRMAIRDLLSLKAGDLLPLDRESAAPVTVKVAGIPKFLASFGSRKHKRAVRILSTLQESAAGRPGEEGEFETAVATRV